MKSFNFLMGFVLVFVLMATSGMTMAQTIDEIQYYNPATGAPESPYVGQQVTVEGTIYVVKGTYNGGTHYMQGVTGGISFYSSSITGLDYGTEVEVTGEVSSFGGEIQIASPSIAVTGQGVEPTPLAKTPVEVLYNYELIGNFVSVIGDVASISGSTFHLTAGDSLLVCYVDSDTEIDLSDVEVGDTYQVSSPCVVYNGLIELKPRLQGDLIPVSDWPILAPTFDIEENLGCSNALPLTFHFEPGLTTPAIKGYSVHVVGDDNVSFTQSDITVFTVPAGESVFHQIIENGPNDFTIDYAILGSETQGIFSAADLFSINLHGQAEGWGNISIIAADFRDLENQIFVVDFSIPAAVYVDCTLPDQITSATAAPGHEIVTLNWVDPSDADLDGILIYRAYWEDGLGASAYPLYGLPGGDEIPVRPSDSEAADASSQWTLIGEANPSAQAYVDSVSERGILFYEFFTRDNAANSGAPADDQAFSTNYWLGDMDISRDGQVTVADLSVLGATYGISTGHDLHNNESDVGPTDDGSGMGIPQPDGYVGFDDLMIVSLNYGEVNPEKSDFHSDGSIYLAWEKIGETEWVCRLESSGGSLKGLHIKSELPSGVTASCAAGSLVGSQQWPVFLRNADQNTLDIGLAIIGQGVVFEGQGELVRVILSGPADLTDVEIEARGKGNEVVAVSVEALMVPTIPLRYQLRQNFPNPFNPSTTISFDLPQDEMVRVAIYSLDGRLVRNLAAERFEAGSHDLVWTGEDDTGRRVASGTYFCRMLSGEFDQIQKMVLTK